MHVHNIRMKKDCGGLLWPHKGDICTLHYGGKSGVDKGHLHAWGVTNFDCCHQDKWELVSRKEDVKDTSESHTFILNGRHAEVKITEEKVEVKIYERI